MLRSPQDLYARLLSSPTHGYPLWTPEPSSEFLNKRPEGLRIGDVGIVVPDNGGFDVLFNLCLPPNHSFHTRYGVPDSFVKCIRPEELEIHIYEKAELPRQVIMTRSVTRVGSVGSLTEAPYGDESNVSTYRFNLSSDEGALLILPEGAERHELRNDDLFVQQIGQNGAEWYDYAVNRRHRTISPNSLYVITGLYKTQSWSNAAFESISGNEVYAARFEHTPDWRSSVPSTYNWETTRAVLSWRSGTSVDHGMSNQTVFIRGLKIALQNGLLGSRHISVKADHPSEARLSPSKTFNVTPSSSWMRDGLARLMRWEEGSASQTTMHAAGSTDATGEQVPSDTSAQGVYEGMHVKIE